MVSNWFGNLPIGKKLIGSFLFVSLIVVIVGGIGFIQISDTISQVDEMAEEDVVFLIKTVELKTLALQHRRYEKDFFLNIGNKEKQNGYIVKFQQVHQKTTALIEAIVKMVKKAPHLFSQEKKAIRDAQISYGRYIEGFLKLTKIVLAEDSITPQKANTLMKPLKESIYMFESNVDVLAEEGLEMISIASEDIV